MRLSIRIYLTDSLTQQKVLNLFIALLLSLFNSEKLKNRKDDEINQIQIAKDRIRRMLNYVYVKIKNFECFKKLVSNKQNVSDRDYVFNDTISKNIK